MRPPLPLLVVTGLTMLVASGAIRLLPFRTLGRLSPPRRRDQRAASEAEADLQTRAIRAWSRRLPWRTKCFEEGLTAHWMLRRRGLASTLSYGAATIDGKLQAHVWVRSGATDVIGCESAGDYAVLATFPAARAG